MRGLVASATFGRPG